ncbi:hypothetical protein N7468_009365 [Penicillium chermesinum]|uniref:Uncharacterized protein n=1 Tax=Penicillium chermesinum TaxID=63820 RepID=A0A9W9TEX0_9EURO|nr:uncharacterized protein N7468_009365 [Penicillium chermesinum]KAJ5220161.1 hypothetical protein N7468_009365 [Penicillium chermesinum]KAJ6157610.1 hypothetical protein N7470_005202 [Penicillium chermesinum]
MKDEYVESQVAETPCRLTATDMRVLSATQMVPLLVHLPTPIIHICIHHHRQPSSLALTGSRWCQHDAALCDFGTRHV